MPKDNFALCELYEQFPTKQSAIEYFEELRWGDTPFWGYYYG